MKASEIREKELTMGRTFFVTKASFNGVSSSFISIDLRICEVREKAIKVQPVKGDKAFWLPKKALVFKKVKGNASYDVFFAEWFLFDDYQFRCIKDVAEFACY